MGDGDSSEFGSIKPWTWCDFTGSQAMLWPHEEDL
jgi:hypothetical protein